MNKKNVFKAVSAIYLIWCLIIGTRETLSMLRQAIINVCEWLINVL